jgi:hypothetical protein
MLNFALRRYGWQTNRQAEFRQERRSGPGDLRRVLRAARAVAGRQGITVRVRLDPTKK